MLLSFLALDLLLSVMARAIDLVHFFLADELISGYFTTGIVNFSEIVEGGLVPSFSCNLPVADSKFEVAKPEFGNADVVTRSDVSSQRACSLEQSGPFLIDGYSDALVVDHPNVCARISRTEFDGPDEAIKCLQVIFG